MENVLLATGFVQWLSHRDCMIHWRTDDPSGTQLQVYCMCVGAHVPANISVCVAHGGIKENSAANVWEIKSSCVKSEKEGGYHTAPHPPIKVP